jgi:hypothetical protein
MSRPQNLAADDLIGARIPIGPAGFVTLVDYHGNDAAIARAARVSYGRHDADRGAEADEAGGADGDAHADKAVGGEVLGAGHASTRLAAQTNALIGITTLGPEGKASNTASAWMKVSP